jgi:DNA-directed RNA polymerase subunit L
MMEIKVLEKEDSSIKFRVVGGTQSVLNLIKEEADSMEDVTFAGFVMEHPLEKSSIFVIKTGGKDAEKTLKKVIEKTHSDLKEARKELNSLFK